MGKSSFTYFQRRRLAGIALEMNDRARVLTPDLKQSIFEFCVHGPDGQEYAILPDCRGTDVGQKIVDQIFSEYGSKIEKATKHFNPYQENIAELVAQIILETDGVFIFKHTKIANGSYSPFYLDGGALTSWPASMNLICSSAQLVLETEIGEYDVLVGGETRGILFAGWVAQTSSKGAGVVRKVKKGHGTGKDVEGNIKEGERVVIGEDLITDGRSKPPFIKHLLEIGAEILAIIVIVDREQGGPQFIKNEFELDVFSLTNISTILKVAVKKRKISLEEKLSIEKYLKDPEAWNIANGYEWPIIKEA